MDENLLLNLALDAGEIMLSAGAETHRVEDTMERILSVNKSIMPEAFATTTGIFAGVQGSLTGSRTRFKRIIHRAINLGKITRVNSMSRKFVAGKITIEEAFEEIAAIHALKDYPLGLTVTCHGVVSSCFTLMFSHNLTDSFASFFIGILLGAANRIMRKYKFSSFLVTLFGSILITVLSVLIHEITKVTNFDNTIIGALMLLVPGVAITNAVRDILEGNYITGNSRIAEAAITAVAIASGVGTVLSSYSRIVGGL